LTLKRQEKGDPLIAIKVGDKKIILNAEKAGDNKILWTLKRQEITRSFEH
jgi:hypothetical protein